MSVDPGSDEAFAIIVRGGQVYSYFGTSVLFDDLDQARDETGELILAVPFRQALHSGRPRSAVEATARNHVSAIRVDRRTETTLAAFVSADAPDDVEIRGGHFDLSDDEFVDRVSEVIRSEIAEGHGSNFVLHRTYIGRLEARTPARELAILRSLLGRESGAYWSYLVHFPDHSLIGVSPEMHLSRREDGITTMNPISGTYRYPAGGPEERSLREFLSDAKERNELYMVVDEELKIMSELCDSRPWIAGPKLRYMSKVAHTEYHVHGRSTLPWYEAIKASLVAPTVLGSPLESAFRMAQRRDASPRGYFGGVLAHVSPAPSLAFDSAILIRTAQIDARGEFSLPVGATIVRDSDPVSEAAETTAKAAGLLSAFSRPRSDLEEMAEGLLEERNREVAEFWTAIPRPRRGSAGGAEARAIVVDHEDRFTGMLAAHLESLGVRVEMHKGSPSRTALTSANLLVLGPGPGDPHDTHDPRIVEARRLARWALGQDDIPVLAVCLSHQMVCLELGLPVRRLPHPNQGSQKTVPFFGREVTVGFYNSFSAFDDGVRRGVETASDPETGEVFAIRRPGLVGVQFHPESVLSVNGASVLEEALDHLRTRAPEELGMVG